MGEANRRGTFEQRKKVAIERDEKARLKKLKRDLEIEKAKTPEQREHEKRNKLMVAQWLGVGLGASSCSQFLFKKLPFH